MTGKQLLRSGFLNLFIAALLLMNSTVYGRPDSERNRRDSLGFRFVLRGGYAHMERIDGLVDLNAEIQLRFSPRISAGLGVGSMSNSDTMHGGSVMEGYPGGSSGGMMGGGMMGSGFDGMSGGFSGHDHTFRAIPFTFSLYYTLPAGARFNVCMIGGAGYYLSSFQDITTQNQNAFGPHLGVGLDFEVAPRMALVADAFYRFVNLKGFASDLHPGFREVMDEMGEHHRDEGSWHFHHSMEEWHFHEGNLGMFQDPVPQDAGEFDLSLSGFSIRVGLRFDF